MTVDTLHATRPVWVTGIDASDLLQQILRRLDHRDTPDDKYPNAKGEYLTLCPFHRDEHIGSFSVSERGYKCFACGAKGGLKQLAAKVGVDVQSGNGTGAGLTLADYARAKHLPLDLLYQWGLSDDRNGHAPRVRFPYYDRDGREVGIRYRAALEGEKRFYWEKGCHVMPYGLDHLAAAQREGYVWLVEGESDAQTCDFHGIPALGIPGADTWKDGWAQYLAGLRVYVWQEPDQGGATFVETVGKSLPDCLIITAPAGRKDISACHMAGDDVAALAQRLMAEAQPYRAAGSCGATACAPAALPDDQLAAHLAGAPTESAPKPQIKTAWTLAELLTTDFPDPPWAVPDIVPVGLTILAGRPKVGKSWLALQMAVAVGSGGRIFDRPVERRKVLYLALEDSARRLSSRLKLMGAALDGGVDFDLAWPAFNRGGMEQLKARMPDYGLVIVDTLSRAFGRADQCDLAEMGEPLGELQQYALSLDMALVILDHHSKGRRGEDGLPAGDPIDDVMGSTAKVATADAILGLFKQQGKPGATLKLVGRDVEWQDWALAWDAVTHCWQYEGTAEEVAVKGERATVLAVLRQYHPEATPQAEIVTKSGMKAPNVSTTLAALADAGYVTSAKQGKSKAWGLTDSGLKLAGGPTTRTLTTGDDETEDNGWGA
jgi:DNA-binding transcriptional ArsR family regulator